MAKISSRKNFIAAVFGTLIEYFDYSLYGFSSAIIASLYFPNEDPIISIIKTFGIFSAGYLSKPLGAFVFGRLGDRLGRSIILKITMLGISIPTLVIGFLPSHDILGAWAAFVLLTCRFIQGFFVGGEYDGVSIYVYEHASQKHKALTYGLIRSTANMGVGLASLSVGIATMHFMPSWGWRIPFILSGFLALFVFVIRSNLTETPEFLAFKKNRVQFEVVSTFANNWRNILVTFLLCGAFGGTYQFYFVFLNTFQSHILGYFTVESSAWVTGTMVISYFIFTPLAGWLSDRYGAVRIIKYSFSILFLMTGLNMFYLQQGYIPWPILMGTTFGLALFHVPGYVNLLQQFNVGERYVCVSIGHSLGSMFFSGFTPLLATGIYKATGITFAPFILFGLTIAIACVAFFWGISSKKEHLAEPILNNAA